MALPMASTSRSVPIMNGSFKSDNLTPSLLAEEVTRRSASNLWFVGRALQSEKRRLFEAAYATMRVIDDFVDDEFLARSQRERDVFRDGARIRIADWLEASMDALEDSAPCSTLSLPDRDQILFMALRDAARGSDLPSDPWQRLADAMVYDIEEHRMLSWPDFDAYCEGATVAPAAVFLFVLQARNESGNLTAGIAASELADQARDMAIFCYLVHILRDFAKDSARGGQLVTIPQSCFRDHGLTRESVAADPGSALPMLRDIADRAGERRLAARHMADLLMPSLGRAEARILDALLSIYECLHDDLAADPSAAIDRSGLTARLRKSLAERLGLV